MSLEKPQQVKASNITVMWHTGRSCAELTNTSPWFDPEQKRLYDQLCRLRVRNTTEMNTNICQFYKFFNSTRQIWSWRAVRCREKSLILESILFMPFKTVKFLDQMLLILEIYRRLSLFLLLKVHDVCKVWQFSLISTSDLVNFYFWLYNRLKLVINEMIHQVEFSFH